MIHGPYNVKMGQWFRIDSLEKRDHLKRQKQNVKINLKNRPRRCGLEKGMKFMVFRV